MMRGKSFARYARWIAPAWWPKGEPVIERAYHGAHAYTTAWPGDTVRLTFRVSGGYSHPTLDKAEAIDLAHRILLAFGTD